MSAVVLPSTDVWIAPYLQLQDRLTAGAWEIAPADDLDVSDFTSTHAFDQATRLVGLYRRPSRVHDASGCFLRRGTSRVGDQLRQERGIENFRRALLLGVIDENRTPWREPVDDPNWGWHTYTSDSLFLVWHRIDPGGWISARYGSVVPTLEGGLTINNDNDSVGLPGSEIAPPAEQHFPMRAAQPDQELVDATNARLNSPDARAPRVAAALDWLDLAWRNSTSITPSMRIVALKAGFEVLLGAGDKLKSQRAALASLLGRNAGRRRRRTPVDWRGNPQAPEFMTDVEWWFTRFTWLRNAIAHGRVTSRSDWRHGRANHFWIGEHWLRAAIRHEVAFASGRIHLQEGDRQTRLLRHYAAQLLQGSIQQ
jgi:hypothetical protein